MARLINFLFALTVGIAAAFFLLGVATLARANDAYVHYYVSADTKNLDQIKALGIGYQSDTAFFYTRLEGGVIYDLRDNSRHPTAFGQASIGVEPELFGSIYLHFFQGVGAVGPSDSYNSGIFQFFEDLGAGIRDRRNGTSVGVSYKHISNAGLVGENRGRDLLGVQVAIPLF